MTYIPPKIRAASTAFLLNEAGELLIVKPNYKEGWLLPGGGIEGGESPRMCALREAREELGLDINILRLLTIDTGESFPGVIFTFWGGVLTEEQIKKILLQASELSEYKFIPFLQLPNFFSEHKVRRYQNTLQAIQENKIYYLEQGKIIF